MNDFVLYLLVFFKFLYAVLYTDSYVYEVSHPLLCKIYPQQRLRNVKNEIIRSNCELIIVSHYSRQLVLIANLYNL